MPKGGKWCNFCGKTVPESHDVNHEDERTDSLGQELKAGSVWIPDVVVVGSGPWDTASGHARFIGGWMESTGM